MKWSSCIIAATLSLAAATSGCAGDDGTSATQPAVEVRRVGIYDSRSVAIAYAGSPKHSEVTGRDKAAYDKAKADGDQPRMDELQKRGRQMQVDMHKMAFGAAPVTDILDQYRTEVKALMRKHRLDALVSRWDEKSLAKYPHAEKIDVTEDLILLPGPNERQKKFALQARDTKPLTEAQLKKLEKDPRF